jgi:hypothetical protein
VLGSDGLAEQENSMRAMFGYDRLENFCTTHAAGGAANLGRQVLDAIALHADGTAQSDDSTLVILGSTQQPADSNPGSSEHSPAVHAEWSERGAGAVFGDVPPAATIRRARRPPTGACRADHACLHTETRAGLP